VPTGPASAIAYSPDGNTIAYVSSSDLSARLWHVYTGRVTGPIGGSPTGAVAFSPDGSTLATLGNTTARLWDTATGNEIGAPLQVPGGTGQYGLAFSPDAQVLAIIGYDGTTLWSVGTQHELTAAPVATANVHGYGTLAYSPDGQILATTSFDGLVRLWDVGFPRNLQAAVCSIAGGPLSRQQWRTYAPAQPYLASCP
jgi:WD40 repeat protein